jgi:hypothetical protein
MKGKKRPARNREVLPAGVAAPGRRAVRAAARNAENKAEAGLANTGVSHQYDLRVNIMDRVGRRGMLPRAQENTFSLATARLAARKRSALAIRLISENPFIRIGSGGAVGGLDEIEYVVTRIDSPKPAKPEPNRTR